METRTVTITNDAEHAQAVEQLIAWNQAPDAANCLADMQALGEVVEAYEDSQGWTPDSPKP